jgi:regulator of replication initiation timing
MAPKTKQIVCAKCKNVIKTRQFLKCSACNNILDILCTNVTDTHFRSNMTKEQKEKWVCSMCCKSKDNLEATKSKISQSPSTENSNITQRKKYDIQVSTKNSFDSLPDDDDNNSMSTTNSTHDCSKINRSCPEIADAFLREKMQSMSSKIEELQYKLAQSDHEIENLLTENKTLKNIIESLSKKVVSLENICKSTPSKKSKQNSSKSALGSTPTVNATRQNGILRDTKVHMGAQTVTELVLDLETRENPPVSKISLLEVPAENMNMNNGNLPAANLPTDVAAPASLNVSNKANKISIISSDKYNMITKTTNYNLGDNYSICHYLYPGVGIRTMLQNVESKLENYTKHDFCIVFIGEEDFKSSQCIDNLVLYIRKVTSKLSHTNIIICYPTYRIGYFDNMFNWRVESFNDILFTDNSKYNYAYLLDSNRNLAYDHEMFYLKSGCIKRAGLNVIFQDICTLITIVQTEHNYDDNSLEDFSNLNLSQNSSRSFFRE